MTCGSAVWVQSTETLADNECCATPSTICRHYRMHAACHTCRRFGQREGSAWALTVCNSACLQIQGSQGHVVSHAGAAELPVMRSQLQGLLLGRHPEEALAQQPELAHLHGACTCTCSSSSMVTSLVAGSQQQMCLKMGMCGISSQHTAAWAGRRVQVRTGELLGDGVACPGRRRRGACEAQLHQGAAQRGSAASCRCAHACVAVPAQPPYVRMPGSSPPFWRRKVHGMQSDQCIRAHGVLFVGEIRMTGVLLTLPAALPAWDALPVALAGCPSLAAAVLQTA